MHPQSQSTEPRTQVDPPQQGGQGGQTAPSGAGGSGPTGGSNATPSNQGGKPGATPAADTTATLQHLDTRTFMQHLRANDLHTWIVSGATLLALVLIVQLLLVIVLRRLDKFATRTKTKWDDVLLGVLKRVRFWLLFPALVWAASQSLDLPDVLAGALKTIAIVGLGIQAIILAMRLVDIGLLAMVERTKGEHGHDPTVASSMGVLRVLAIMVVGVVVVLLALDNLGVKVTPMLTGLGIGGVAVALAVQSILSDLFGSLTIILDKPFVVGDSIQVGDKSGTVERIGVKTTRVRATSGEQLVFANSDLLSSRVQNFKRMDERRVQFVIGLVYDTPREKVALADDIIAGAIKSQKDVRFDRCHFRGFGPNSLEFEAVYFVQAPDYMLYMDRQQDINLKIMEGFARAGIEIAPAGQPFSRKHVATLAAASKHPTVAEALLGKKEEEPASQRNGVEGGTAPARESAGSPPRAGGDPGQGR